MLINVAVWGGAAIGSSSCQALSKSPPSLLFSTPFLFLNFISAESKAGASLGILLHQNPHKNIHG